MKEKLIEERKNLPKRIKQYKIIKENKIEENYDIEDHKLIFF
jgi:hypothetical protein